MQNGVKNNAITNQRNYWRQGNPSKTEDLFVKYHRVVAPSAHHQQKTDNYNGNTDDHKLVIAFAQGKSFVLWLIGASLI